MYHARAAVGGKGQRRITYRCRRLVWAAGGLAVLGVCATPLPAAGPVGWAVDGDGQWIIGANWSDGAVPGFDDDVVIDRPAGDFLITLGSGSHSVKSVATSERLTVSNATLSIADELRFSRELTLSSATIVGGSLIGEGVGGVIRVPTSSGGATLDGVELDAAVNVVSGLLRVRNGLSLQGKPITITSEGATAAEMRFVGTQTLGGSGEVVFNGMGSGRLGVFGDGAVLTIGPGVTVRSGTGGGTVGSTGLKLINQARIVSGTAGKMVTVVGEDWVNGGVLEARDGGELGLAGTIATPSLGNWAGVTGRVSLLGTLANTGATLELTPETGPMYTAIGRIVGGRVRGTGGVGLIGVGGNTATLEGVALEAPLEVRDTQTIRVVGGLTLVGQTVTLKDAGAGAPTRLMFPGTQTLGGVGQVVFEGTADTGAVHAVGLGSALTVGPEVTIRTGTRGGSLGGIGLELINQGTISSQTAGRTVSIRGLFNNQGVMEARNGGTMALIDLPVNYSAAERTLGGGAWNVYENGTITFPVGMEIATLGAGASVLLSGAGSKFDALENHVVSNAGQLTVAAGRTFAPGRAFANSGLLTVAAGGVVNLTQGGVNTGTVHTEFGAQLRFGGGYTHAAGSVVSGDAQIDFVDGVNVIEGAFVGAFALSFSGGTTRVAAGGSLSPGSFTVSGGANVVEAGGTINVGAGGLTFTGGASPSLILGASTGPPGRLRLGGDVTAAVSGGTAGLLTGAGKVGDQPGAIDLMGAQRSFTVSDGGGDVDLSVSARVTNGSLRKAGPGLMRLTHVNNTYTGETVIANGTLEVTEPGGLGPAEVVFSGGTLSLRSDLVAATWNNDLRGVSDADGVNVAVGRITAAGGAAGVFEVRGLRVGAAVLRVSGADRGLRFTGPAQLAGNATVDNDVSVEFIDAVRQSGGTFGLTKNGPGVLTLSGVLDNQYAGATRVQDGLLLLNKAGGALAAAGDLEIFGGAVRLLGHEQVADTAALRMGNASALLDLNGRTESVATANLTAGATVAGPGQLNVAGSLLAPGGVVSARPGGMTRISAGAVNNTGVFEARDGGTLVIDGAAVKLVNYQPASGTLAGGTWRIIGNSAIRIDGVAVSRLAAAVVLDGAEAKLLKGDPASPQSDALVGLTSIAPGGSLTLRNGRNFAPLAGPFASEGTLRVGPGSRFTAAGPMSVTGTLELEAGGRMDLKEHALVYRATAGTRDAVLAQMNEAVRSARNGAGARWQGPGLTSSSVPAAMELGVALNERGAGSFAGMTVDASTVLVGLTVAGDADLSGDVNAADYFLIDRGRALRRAGWYFGDFDYSGGAANGDDYVLIDRSFLDQQVGGALSISAPAQAVPEPGLIVCVGLGLLGLRRGGRGMPRPSRQDGGAILRLCEP